MYKNKILNCQRVKETNHNKIFFFRYADQLSLGDEMLVQEGDELTAAKVISMKSLIAQGIVVIK